MQRWGWGYPTAAVLVDIRHVFVQNVPQMDQSYAMYLLISRTVTNKLSLDLHAALYSVQKCVVHTYQFSAPVIGLRQYLWMRYKVWSQRGVQSAIRLLAVYGSVSRSHRCIGRRAVARKCSNVIAIVGGDSFGGIHTGCQLTLNMKSASTSFHGSTLTKEIPYLSGTSTLSDGNPSRVDR